MHVWRYELGTWIEEDVPIPEGQLFPEGFDRAPFMSLGDTGPEAKGVGVAVHEATEGNSYLVTILAGEEALDPVLASDFPSLIDLLAKLAPIVSAARE
jgi:hypothetical protein